MAVTAVNTAKASQEIILWNMTISDSVRGYLDLGSKETHVPELNDLWSIVSEIPKKEGIRDFFESCCIHPIAYEHLLKNYFRTPQGGQTDGSSLIEHGGGVDEMAYLCVNKSFKLHSANCTYLKKARVAKSKLRVVSQAAYLSYDSLDLCTNCAKTDVWSHGGTYHLLSNCPKRSRYARKHLWSSNDSLRPCSTCFNTISESRFFRGS
jgi:hypothetical protein